MRSRSSPPYDLAAAGVTRHVVYLSAADAVFVFEGSEVERRLHELVTAPSQSARTSALEEWRDIVDGPARIARETFAWDAKAERPPPGNRTGPRLHALDEQRSVQPIYARRSALRGPTENRRQTIYSARGDGRLNLEKPKRF